MPNNNYSELCTIGNITGYTLTNSIQIERERAQILIIDQHRD
jgi:hypothetical protein